MSALLQIDGITKRFGPVTAVDKIALEVMDGEFFAILGPSGCGKTTLLRVIAGFETPDEGRVRLAGADITELKANRRPVNLMFQSYALFPHMTAAGNVAYGLEMEGLQGAELKKRVDQALAMVRMAEFAGRKPNQLSGGQRQRVALARALAAEPELLLLDEPFTALDAPLRARLRDDLLAMQRRRAVPMVVITHDPEDVAALGGRLIHLDNGRVIEQVKAEAG